MNPFLSILSKICLQGLVACCLAAPATAETLRLWLLAGEGNALPAVLEADERPAFGQHPAEQALWMADGEGGWRRLAEEDGTGVELGFARLAWQAGWHDIGLLRLAVAEAGNTRWQAAEGDLWQELALAAEAAMEHPPAGWEEVRIEGLLFLQGESNDGAEAAAAGERVAAAFDALRDRLPGGGDMRLVIGPVAGAGTDRDTTRAAHAALAAAREDVGLAAAAGLEALTGEDGFPEWTADSRRLIGHRLAAEALRLGSEERFPLPAREALHTWLVADAATLADSGGGIVRWGSLHDGGGARDLTRRVAGRVGVRSVTAGDGSPRQVLGFDGGSDLWAAAAEFGSISGPRSVSILCRVAPGAEGFLFDGSTGSGRSRAQVRGGNWQAGVEPPGGPWAAAGTVTAPAAAGSWQRHVFTYAPDLGGTRVEHWIDGERVADVLSPGETALGGLILGSNGGSPFTRLAVEIAELAVHHRALSADEIQRLDAHWSATWGEPGGPPAAIRLLKEPREIARFGLHPLLRVEIDDPGEPARVLTSLAVRLDEASAAAAARLHWVDAGSGADLSPGWSGALATLEDPVAGVWRVPLELALAEGTRHLQLMVEPRRHAPLGSRLEAEWVEVGIEGGASPPLPADRPGALTLALVPYFADVVRSGQDGIHTMRIPGIAADGNGVLHAVYDHRYANAGDLPADIDVGYSRSTDGGATWSPTRVILGFDPGVPGSRGNGVGDPTILHDPVTDTLWVAALWSFGDRGYHGSGPGISPEETGQYVLVKSEDGGESWSEPINITSQVKDPAWRLLFNGPGHGLALRDGTLVFPSQYRDAAGTVRVCFVFSQDHGASWRFGSAIPTSSPQTNENTVCELDDGRLLFSMRTPTNSIGQRAWAHFTPGGEDPFRDGAWGPLFRLPSVPDPVCQGSVIQWTSRHRGDPREWLLFGNPASPSSRVNFTLRVSPDGGDSWPVARSLYAGSAAYSSICILPDRSIGVLLELDGYSRITFARVEEGWIWNPEVDRDGDGLPDAWEILHGTDPLVADSHLDPDGDGMTHLQEYLAGTDPFDARSALRWIEPLREDGKMTWSTVPGRFYQVEGSDDLLDWRPLEGAGALLATGESLEWASPDPANERGFFRVRVLP